MVAVVVVESQKNAPIVVAVAVAGVAVMWS